MNVLSTSHKKAQFTSRCDGCAGKIWKGLEIQIVRRKTDGVVTYKHTTHDDGGCIAAAEARSS